MAAPNRNFRNAIIASVRRSSAEKSMVPPSVPIPDTLRGVDDLIRISFENFRALWFERLLTATLLVVVGLVLEGPELSHEIRGIKRHWSFTWRFHFSLPEDSPPHWAKLLAFIGWVLIVGGVAGEFVADSFVSRADGYVQTFDEILLTETTNRTALANARASAAYERASKNEKETAETLKQAQRERADAARSLEVTKGYELQIARANEQAESAKRDALAATRTAEQERLARIRLEDTLSGWKLDGAAQRRVLGKIRPFPKTPFDLAVNQSEYAFMEIIDGLLHSAGWSRQLPKAGNPLGQFLIDGKASVWLGSGMYIEFSADKAKEFNAPTEALLKALRDEGIPAKGHVVTEGSEPNAIHIVIGKRE